MDNQNPPRVFGLVRASDIKQTESCATQSQLIEAACKSLGLPAPTVLEEPPGTSGYKTKFCQRPMGCYLLRTLQKGDVLVTLRLDRVGRSMSDCYQTIETFFNRGVRIVIIKGWSSSIVDLHDPTSRLLLAILSWVSEEEARKVAERTKEGLDFRRRNGLSAGKRAFTFIQNYDADGNEISSGEFDRTKGHCKRNLPDAQLLDQICELLALNQAGVLRGNGLYDYCEERGFVDRRGKQWWKSTVFINPRGIPYRNEIQRLLKRVRRMAVRGELPEDYNDRVLMITGDTPAVLAPKFKRKPRAEYAAAADARAHWTLEDWQQNFLTGQEPSQASLPRV